jgi:tRNA-dihydrouridine synthase C
MRPDLGRLIKQRLSKQTERPLSWPEIGALLLRYFEDQSKYYDAKYTPSPVKQWLVYLKHYHSPAALLFEQIKKIRDPIEFGEALNKHLRSTAP